MVASGMSLSKSKTKVKNNKEKEVFYTKRTKDAETACAQR